jgi:alanyl-tRNA synthetase
MAEELGLGVNNKEYEEAQTASREASKASLKVGSKDVVKLDVHDIAALENNSSVPKTDDSAKFGKDCRSQVLFGLTHYLKALATLMRASRQYTIGRPFSNRRKTFQRMLFSVLSSTKRVSTQRLGDKSMTLAIL